MAVGNGKEVFSWGSNTAGQLGFSRAELAMLELRETSLNSTIAASNNSRGAGDMPNASQTSATKVFKEPSRRLLGLPGKVPENQEEIENKKRTQEEARTAIPRLVHGLHDVEQLVCGSHHSACLSCTGYGEILKLESFISTITFPKLTFALKTRSRETVYLESLRGAVVTTVDLVTVMKSMLATQR